jgi:DME family drug/metabolite transporter
MLFGLLFVSLAAFFWGTQGGVVTEFTDRAGSGAIETAFMASGIGAAVLLSAGVGIGRPWPPLGAGLLAAAAIGGVVAVFIGSYFAAVSLMGIALAALVAICSAPLFTTVLAIAFLNERLTRAATVALVAGVGGTALILVGPSDVAASSGGRTVAGLLLALMAGLALAARIVLIRGLVARIHPLQLAALSWCGAAIFLGALVVVRSRGLGSVAAGWPWLLYLGIVAMTFGPMLHAAGIQRISSIPAAIAGLLEPLTATVVALVIFDEHLTIISWVGAALILLAVIILAVASDREGGRLAV